MERNRTFTILSCFGILLVVLGHLNWGILEFGGLFPYYSYHVCIFVFIAGYFYKPEDECKIVAYLRKKCMRLLVPYLIGNAVIGVLILILHKIGIIFGRELTLNNLLVAPFCDGHQFMLNAPGWFIPALFLFETVNICGRRLLRYVKINNEYILMLLYLFVGIASVILSQHGFIYDWYRVPGRIMFMAPVFQAGRLYHAELERFDKGKGIWNNIGYFGVILILNLILCKTQGGLAFSAAWVNGFSNNPLIPYVTTATGIALWLRVSKLIAGVIGKSEKIWKLFDYVGRHTFEICMYHLCGCFVVNTIIKVVSQYSGMFSGFDDSLYRGDAYYAYVPEGMEVFKMIYLLMAFLLPLVLCRFKERVLRITVR